MNLRISIVGAALLSLAIAAFASDDAAALLKAGRMDDAIKTLNANIASHPNNANAYGTLCKAYQLMGDYDRAIQNCQKAINIDPNISEYHLWLGRAYGDKADDSNPFSAWGLAKKVAASFERAVQLAPGSVAARNDLAEFYSSAPGVAGGGDDKARRIAAETEHIDPAAAANMRAQFALKDKDYQRAEQEERKAIEASGNAAQYWLELARIISKQKDWMRFESAISKSFSAAKHRPLDTFNAADLMISNGRNLEGAIKLMNEYLAGPMDEEGPAFRAHFLIGRAYEKLGNKTSAANEYRQALALASGFRPAREALKRVNG